MKRFGSTGLVLAAAVLTGCGSTVGMRGSVVNADPGLEASADPVSEVASGRAGLPGAGSSSGAGAVTATGAGSASVGGAAQPGGSPAGGGPQRVPGAPVEVGFLRFESVDYGSFGFKGVSAGDTAKEIALMVARINRSGGLAGHPVKPVVFTFSGTSPNWSSDEQAACDSFTQDHEVVAVAGTAQHSAVLRSCLAARGVPFFASSVSSIDDDDLARTPGFVQADNTSLTVRARALAEGLASDGFFAPTATGPAVIGLLRLEGAGYDRAVKRALIPALAAHGLKVAVERTFPDLNSTGDGGERAQLASQAVLAFSQAKVNRVLVLEQEGTISLTFMTSAESQLYRPAYGLTSQSLLQGFLATNVPPRQLQGAKAIGWMPVYDVVAADQGTSVSRASCLKTFRDGGLTLSDANSTSIALNICDSALSLQAASRGTGGQLGLSNLMTGVSALGGSYTSPTTFRTDFSRHRDGAATYRLVAFDEGCGCFGYASPPRVFAR